MVATSATPIDELGGNLVNFERSINERADWIEFTRDEEFGYLIILYLIDQYREKFEVQIMQTGSKEVIAKSSFALTQSDMANMRIKLQSRVGHFSIYNSDNEVLD